MFSSRTRYASFLAAMAFAASCQCQPDQCPAFNPEGTGYIPPTEGDSIVFASSAGIRIAFGVKNIITSPAHESHTRLGALGGCSSENCSSHGGYAAQSAQGRNGSFTLFADFEAEGGNDGRSILYRTQHGQVFDMGFNLPTPGDTAGFGQVELNRQLGGRLYDTLFVQQQDTIRPFSDTACIWRVYIHRPEGVVGFEDRQTRALFYRE